MMKKWVLSRRDSAETLERIETALGVSLDIPRTSQGTCEEPKEGVVFVHFGPMVFVEAKGRFTPFLGSPEALSLFHSVTVDEGAIRFLLNGADVMKPGIRKLDSWGEAGKLVVVKEEKKGRAITVGEALVTSDEAAAMTRGPCLKNLHHVGDEYWSLYKTV